MIQYLFLVFEDCFFKMENCSWGEEHGSWNYIQSEMHRHSNLVVPRPPPGGAATEALHYGCYHPATLLPPWAPPFDEVADDRTANASRSHSEAEKRRRDRINAQLATLRKLIPKSEKMDKAALLGHVVDHVREQSKRAKEVSKFSTIPTEIDEVIVDLFSAEESTSQDNQNIYIKALICCDDRPEVFAELNSALKGLGITIAKAEITSLGGRMKADLVLCAREQNSFTSSFKQSLKLALSRIATSSGSSSYRARSKRQRFFYPNSR